MTRTFSIFITLLLFVSASAFAQTGTVKGRVTDAGHENEPVIAATVVLLDTAYKTKPDSLFRKYALGGMVIMSDSGFTFRDVKPGQYALRATMIGYIREEKSVTVKTDSVSVVIFQLREAPFEEAGPMIQFPKPRATLPSDTSHKEKQPIKK